MKEVTDILLKAIEEGSFPGASYAIVNESGFMDKFQKADDVERERILDVIMQKTDFEDYHNLLINDWLRRDYADLCAKKGIAFEERK